jgi:hypothetical protein
MDIRHMEKAIPIQLIALMMIVSFLFSSVFPEEIRLNDSLKNIDSITVCKPDTVNDLSVTSASSDTDSTKMTPQSKIIIFCLVTIGVIVVGGVVSYLFIGNNFKDFEFKFFK